MKLKVSKLPAMALGLATCILTSCNAVDSDLNSELGSICGPTDDMQDVEFYDGTFTDFSNEFVAFHQARVGVILDENGKGFCSGTLVADDLFLTAGHCISDRISSVGFDFQIGKERTEFDFVEVAERTGLGDYATIRLAGNPGQIYGFAKFDPRKVVVNEPIIIIQHPLGGVKKVHAGTVKDTSFAFIHYSNVDTEAGSSGAGVLDKDGYLVGVHTRGGCGVGGGINQAMQSTHIARGSEILNKKTP